MSLPFKLNNLIPSIIKSFSESIGSLITVTTGFEGKEKVGFVSVPKNDNIFSKNGPRDDRL